MKKSTRDLRRAVKYDDIHLARAAIADGANVNAKLSNGSNLLFEVKSRPMAQLLIDSGTDMLIEDRNGNTALAIILMSGRTDVLELFLDYSTPVDAIVDEEGKTLLTKAASRGHAPEIELLLRRGASLDMKDRRGWTALLEAASWGNTELVELLIRYGADVNAQDRNGNTPLHWAVTSFMGYPKMAQILLDAGSDLAIVNKNRISALDIVQESGNNEIRNIIEHHAKKQKERHGERQDCIFDLNL